MHGSTHQPNELALAIVVYCMLCVNGTTIERQPIVCMRVWVGG